VTALPALPELDYLATQIVIGHGCLVQPRQALPFGIQNRVPIIDVVQGGGIRRQQRGQRCERFNLLTAVTDYDAEILIDGQIFMKAAILANSVLFMHYSVFPEFDHISHLIHFPKEI
jgi:hypothetical protein